MTKCNPDFGMIERIHSYCAELFGVLAIFLFLQEYCSCFLIELTSPIELYCDNEEVITKLTAGINYFDEKHKTTDLDAVMKLEEFLTRSLKVFHVKGHQDSNKTHTLTIPEQLNVKVNKLISQR